MKRKNFYNPHDLTDELRNRVLHEGKRKYHRFRSSAFMNSAVADCTGCNLRCSYCWGHLEKILDGLSDQGELYSAKDVIQKLVQLCQENDLENLRVSGGEPILDADHTLALLKEAKKAGKTLILETNGILLASEEGFVEKLSQFDNLHLRISLKGATPEEFAQITGAHPEFHELQQKAVKLAEAHGIDYSLATINLLPKGSLRRIKRTMSTIDKEKAKEMKVEAIIPHPAQKK